MPWLMTVLIMPINTGDKNMLIFDEYLATACTGQTIHGTL
jgi:hypothetical protein